MVEGTGEVPQLEDAATPKSPKSLRVIEWVSLTPPQQLFSFSLIDYIHQNRAAQEARDRYQVAGHITRQAKRHTEIAQAAEKCKEWAVYGENGFDTFHKGLEVGEKSILNELRLFSALDGDAFGGDPRAAMEGDRALSSAAVMVLVSEREFFKVLGKVISEELIDLWEKRWQDNKLLDPNDELYQWVEDNYRDGKETFDTADK